MLAEPVTHASGGLSECTIQRHTTNARFSLSFWPSTDPFY